MAPFLLGASERARAGEQRGGERLVATGRVFRGSMTMVAGVRRCHVQWDGEK
jgi:hypothetical protein